MNTHYELLGEPASGCPLHYRGVYRHGPKYQPHLSDTAPANCAWREYVDLEERLPTCEQALKLADAFRESGQELDIVQIQHVEAPPGRDLAGQIGFDVSQRGGYSLLSWGLHWNETPSLPPPPLGPLMRLLESYFRPLLNEGGLFPRWSDARFFLDVVEAISVLAPGTWEAPGHEGFEIVRLVCIQPASTKEM
jgi:hypothetical protein